MRNYAEIVKLLVDDPRMTSINTVCHINNSTPLFVAVQYEFVDIVKILVKASRIDVNIAFQPSNLTPIYFAVRNRFVDIVNILVKASGIDVNIACEPSVETPLLTAAFLGFTEIVQLLVQHTKDTIDVNKTNRKGEAPLYMATRNEHFEIVQILLEYD